MMRGESCREGMWEAHQKHETRLLLNVVTAVSIIRDPFSRAQVNDAKGSLPSYASVWPACRVEISEILAEL
jgi:hypothetical protein